MKLYAISDLHLGHPANRQAITELKPHPEDWLAVAGDIGESEEHFRIALTILTQRFARVLWTPGNHDLWTLPSQPNALRGEAKYLHWVDICRDFGVLTPEDPYTLWPADDKYLLAPIFTLYDYSYRPPDVAEADVVAWADELNNVCADEMLLHPDPYPTRAAWCAARCTYTERRLAAVLEPTALILISHYPLRRAVTRRLRLVPRFTPWCGTTQTEDWHRRFPIAKVVYGHLHIRVTDEIDGVYHEEVSFGYPRQWQQEVGINGYLKQIL